MPASVPKKALYWIKHSWNFLIRILSLVKSVYKKIFFLFLNENIRCGYSKEPSHRDGSFEHPKHMFKQMGKKIFTILRSKLCLSKPVHYYLCILPVAAGGSAVAQY